MKTRHRHIKPSISEEKPSMTTMHRRHFLEIGSLAAIAGTIGPSVAFPGSQETPSVTSRMIRFDNDGLGLTPQEYSSVLNAVATDKGITPDYYSLGGAVAEMEQKFAALLGKEAAVFMPTGTLANHIALRKLAGENKRVLVQAESHMYNDCGDCAESLSGLNLIPLAAGQATFGVDEVERWVQRTSGGRVEAKVGVISIETPVRRKHHEMFDYEEMKKISVYARENGIKLHLDGARLFNVPHHSGKSIVEYSSLFDTVYVSLWKCFNSASGAVLAGSKSFTDGLFHVRRMFGGSLPQAWPFASVAMHYADDYLRDYSRAWNVADEFLTALQKSDRVTIGRVTNGTSAFQIAIPGVAPLVFAERLLKKNIVLPQPQKDTGVFWMTINTTLNRISARELAGTFLEAARL
jgi:threonine aldolase